MYDVTCFLYFLYVITPPRSNISCEDMLGIPMAVDDDRWRQFLVSVREVSQSSELAGYFRAKASQQKAHNKLIRQPYWTESASEHSSRTSPRRAGSVRKTGAASHAAMLQCAWELGLVAGYALREREVVGSIPAVPLSPHRTICCEQPGSRGTRAPPTQAE